MKLVIADAKIIGEDGEVLGTLKRVEIPVTLVEPTPAVEGGTTGGVGRSGEQNEQQQLLEGESEGEPFDSAAEVRKQVDAVWAEYVRLMKPRRAEASEEERKIIRAALKVASVEECCLAIGSCFSSDYHMKRGSHAGRTGGRYNRLTQILKGRRGRETTRERIDFFLDRAGNSGEAPHVPSSQRAIVQQRQQDVQRGHRLQTEDAVEKAREAEAWLLERGIETVRRESDGFPMFQPAVAKPHGAK